MQWLHSQFQCLQRQNPTPPVSWTLISLDNFYTSPSLFLEVAWMRFGACPYRENRKGWSQQESKCPHLKIRKRHSEMDQRGSLSLHKMDGHLGSVNVLYNTSGIFWRGSPKESKGPLGSEEHSLRHPYEGLQQEHGWS